MSLSKYELKLSVNPQHVRHSMARLRIFMDSTHDEHYQNSESWLDLHKNSLGIIAHSYSSTRKHR